MIVEVNLNSSNAQKPVQIHNTYFIFSYSLCHVSSLLLTKNALYSLTKNIVGSIVADAWSLAKTAMTTISVLLIVPLLLCTHIDVDKKGWLCSRSTLAPRDQGNCYYKVHEGLYM